MSTSVSGRAPFVILVLAAIAALAILFVVADPFGGGEEITREDADRGAGDLREEGAGEDAKADPREEAGLAGRYGEGDLGAVRLRLLDVVQRLPMPDQPLTLVTRTGGETKTTSGTDGVGLFSRVAPGRSYRLEIGGEGHAAVTIQGVKVHRGETTDLGDILLGENVVLRGRVMSDSGRPLPGAAVAVYTPERSMIGDGIMFSMVKQATQFPSPVERTLTDDGGWFALTSLKTGSYRLEARLAGYATRYESDIVVSKDRPARDMTIVLGEGAMATGKVVDDAGKAVAGARVVAIRATGPRFMPSMGTLERDVAFSDSAGTYALDTLTMGTSYMFGVVAEGYAPLFEMSPVEMEHKRVEKDFQIVLGGTIKGRILRKDDAQPLEGAQIIVALGQFGFGPRGGNRDERREVGTGTGRTKDDGTFVMENLLPGPVMSAQVKAPGYVTFTASTWTGNGWPNVQAGEVVEVVVELETGGVVEGTILDATTQKPIAGADVTIMPQNSMRAMFTGTPVGRTDAAGKYSIGGVRPGKYGVLAVAPGFAPSDARADETAVEIPESGGVVSRNVSLKRAGVVTGIVKDAQGEPVAGARVRTSAAPREGGGGGGRGRGFRNQMAAMLPGGSSADLTDQDGRFVIEDVSSDRRWILTVEADEYVDTESDPFQVGAGDTKKVDVVLSTGGALEGRVVDDRGGFVVGARVRVGYLPPDTASSVNLVAWQVDRLLNQEVYFTDDHGRFRAANLRSGQTVVKVELEGYITFYKRNVVITANETWGNYMVSLTRGDVMEGRVRGARGQPLENVWVGLTSRDDPMAEDEEGGEPNEDIEPMMLNQTDQDGKFRIENVKPGMYSVVVWWATGHKNWRRDQAESAIRRGVSSAATQVEFRLEAQEEGAGGFGGNRGGNR